MSGWQIPPPESSAEYEMRRKALEPEGTRLVSGQHSVSRALLKGFAAPGSGGKGWMLTPYDLQNNRVLKPCSIRTCGKVPNYLGYASASAEDLWNGIETNLPAAIEAARAGSLHHSPANVETMKDCIALHLVRSIRYREVHRNSAVGAAVDVRQRMLAQRAPLLAAEFYRQHGVFPAGEEALGAVLDGHLIKWLDSAFSGELSRVGIEFTLERVRATLRSTEVEYGIRRRAASS